MGVSSIRRFAHRGFAPAELAARKAGRLVSVCIPARDEEATIGPIVETVRRELQDAVGLVDEILVVDDGSADTTPERAREAGARVVRAGSVMASRKVGGGKGQALWKAVFECRGDLIAFCDGDVRDFGAHFVTGLLGPLIADDRIALVKATYERPLQGAPGGGGRVTELTARPVLSLLFPQLADVSQPLAGESASRREVLEQLPFSSGYGVEIGLLIEVATRYGVESIAQVDLGTRTHRNRTLVELGPQAVSVMQVALAKSGLGDGTASHATLPLPGLDPVRVDHAELPALNELPEYSRRKRKGASHVSRAKASSRGQPLPRAR